MRILIISQRCYDRKHKQRASAFPIPRTPRPAPDPTCCSGEKLRVSALGGSITAGQGVGGPDHVYLKNFMDWLNAAMPPRQKHHRSLAADSG